MTAFYDSAPQSEEKSLEAISKALEKGYNFFDTAWIYQSFGKGGVPNQYNEELLGKGKHYPSSRKEETLMAPRLSPPPPSPLLPSPPPSPHHH